MGANDNLNESKSVNSIRPQPPWCPMSVHEASPLENFHNFLGEQLRSSRSASISPEEALLLWRERQETIEAIREGLDDVESGRVKLLDEFLREFENRHRIEPHG